MRTLHGLTFLAGLLLVTSPASAAIVSVQNVETLANVGEINVGVFLTNDSGAELLLGGYDIPLDFGSAGVTPLPAGISYLGAGDSIITFGSTLGSIVDPTGAGDIVVQEASTGIPPFYPSIADGATARLVNLRFDIGAAALGTSFSITPIAGHLFFNVNDSANVQQPITGIVAGGLKVVPEPSGLLALGMFTCLLVYPRRRNMASFDIG
jgi:hypothetical protein